MCFGYFIHLTNMGLRCGIYNVLKENTSDFSKFQPVIESGGIAFGKKMDVLCMIPTINQAKRERRKPSNPGKQMVIKIPDKVTLLSGQQV